MKITIIIIKRYVLKYLCLYNKGKVTRSLTVFVVGYFCFTQGVVACCSLSIRDILCVRCFPAEHIYPTITSRSTNKNFLSVSRNTARRRTISIFEFRILRDNFRMTITCLKKKSYFTIEEYQ